MLRHVRFHSLFNFTQKLTPAIGEGEVLKLSYRMGQTLKGDQILCGGMNPIDTVFINCTLLSFKMQLIFPGLEYIGILSIRLPFNQTPATLFIFSL